MAEGKAPIIRDKSPLLFLNVPIVGLVWLFCLALITGCNTNQSARSQARDTEITAQVKARLASDVSASSLTDIQVNMTNGVVTLAGEVASQDVKARAEQVTSSIPGVVSVNNNLQVTAAFAAP